MEWHQRLAEQYPDWLLDLLVRLGVDAQVAGNVFPALFVYSVATTAVLGFLFWKRRKAG